MANYLDLTGLTYLVSKIKTLVSTKADKTHTHNYAGSSSAGGAATSALTCTGNAATATVADKAKNANSAVFVIPSNGTTNAEGGELQLGNQDGTLWNIDTLSNKLRIYDSNGVIHMTLDKTYANDYFLGNASSSTKTNGLSSTGFGNTNFTFCQTEGTFDGNSGWCNYLIANHGDGATYYHYTIGLPFSGSPIYQRQTGSSTSKSGWHKFYTTENITYGTAALTPGTSSLTTGSIYLQYE